MKKILAILLSLLTLLSCGLLSASLESCFLFLLRHSVCFSVMAWTSLLSSSLSSVRRQNRSAPLAVVPSKSTAKSSKVDCVDKGLTRPQVMQRLSPPTVALICWFSFLTGTMLPS